MCEYCEFFEEIPSSFYEESEVAAWAIRFAQGTSIGLKELKLVLHGRQGLSLKDPFSGGILAHAWALYRPVSQELVKIFEKEGLLYATDQNSRTLAELLAYNGRAYSPASTHSAVCANGNDRICHLLAAFGRFTPVLDVVNSNGFNAATLLYEVVELPEEFYHMVQWDLIGEPAQQEIERIKSYVLSYDY